MNETAINYFLVELDRMLKDLELFSKQQGISLGAAKRANEMHKEIIELIRPFSTDKLSVEKLQEQLNTAKEALTEISKTKDFYRSGRDHWEEFSQDALKAQKTLTAIGNEGSGDE